MKNYFIISVFFLAAFFTACDPQQDSDIDLGPSPEPPTFNATPNPENPNQIIIASTAAGFFDEVWSLPQGTPNRSTKAVDTVFYASAGTYEITLYASKEGGSGTSSSTQVVTIEQDATIECDPLISALTGECTEKCWRLSEAAGGIMVGPQQLSGEWFSSNGIEPTQADDRWCFTFDGAGHEYVNNGSSFSACQGFVEDAAYPVPVGVGWSVVPSGTMFSEMKIVLDNEDSWMGVEDSGPEYEIVSITDDEMVLLSPTKPCDGSASTGWFTLTFFKD